MSDETTHTTEIRRDRSFAVVPESLIDDGRLSHGAFRLWVALDRYANRDREAWPSSSTLARRLGTTRKTIRRWLDELVETGWVERTRTTRDNGATSASLLTLREGALTTQGGGAHDPGGGSSAPPYVNESHLTRVIEGEPSRALARRGDSSPVAVDDVLRVLQHWAMVARDAGVISREPTLTPGRREKIMRRLREGYTVAQLHAAIDGAFASTFHRQKPAWLELTSILGSREKVDRHILTAEGASASQSDRARRVEGAARVLSMIE